MEIVNIWDCFKLLNVLFRRCRAQSSGVKFGIFWKLFMCLNSKNNNSIHHLLFNTIETHSYDIYTKLWCFLWLVSFDVEHADWVIILNLDQWLNIASRPRRMRKFMQCITHHPPPTTHYHECFLWIILREASISDPWGSHLTLRYKWIHGCWGVQSHCSVFNKGRNVSFLTPRAMKMNTALQGTVRALTSHLQ